MTKLNKELADKIKKNYADNNGEFDKQDIDEAIKCLNENLGKEIYWVEHAIISRAIFDDDKLSEEFDKCKAEEKENVFE